MKYWEGYSNDVVKPSLKDVKKLVFWQRPFGYAFLLAIYPIFFVIYLLGISKDGQLWETE